MVKPEPISSFEVKKDVQNNYDVSQTGNNVFQSKEEFITFRSKVVNNGAIKEFDFSSY